ncbi:MAG: hypothetical protein AAF633_22680 [Chloroflexota bacterium]
MLDDGVTEKEIIVSEIGTPLSVTQSEIGYRFSESSSFSTCATVSQRSSPPAALPSVAKRLFAQI